MPDNTLTVGCGARFIILANRIEFFDETSPFEKGGPRGVFHIDNMLIVQCFILCSKLPQPLFAKEGAFATPTAKEENFHTVFQEEMIR
jgi:hypothetical protein